MSRKDSRGSVQHRWQFQMGVACLVLPFLYLMAHYAAFYRTTAGEQKVDASQIEAHVNAGMNITFWLLPIMLVGLIFIVAALVRKS